MSFLYAVFDADGFECKFLAGVFSTEDKAMAFAASLRAHKLALYEGDQSIISVETVVIDQPMRVSRERLGLNLTPKQ